MGANPPSRSKSHDETLTAVFQVFLLPKCTFPNLDRLSAAYCQDLDFSTSVGFLAGPPSSGWLNNPLMTRLLFAGNEFLRNLGKVLRGSSQRVDVEMSRMQSIPPSVAACSEGNGHGPSWPELRVRPETREP